MSIWKSGINRDYPCYECVFPKTTEKAPITNCREAGIIGPVTGLIGSLLVNEAIKEMLSINEIEDDVIIVMNQTKSVHDDSNCDDEIP